MPLPKIGCPKCNHDGYTVADDGRIISCECIIRKRLRSAYEAIGIPRSLFDADIEQFQIRNTGHGSNATELNRPDSKLKEKAKNRVISYMRQMDGVFRSDEDFTFGGPGTGERLWSGRTIALCGGHGSGKSLLAVCIAKAAIKVGVTPKIVQWADVIEACYDFDHDNEENSLSAMASVFARVCPIIIENFSMNYETRRFPTETSGTGGLNPVTRRRIDSLFSPVHQRGLPLVLTTSHQATDLNVSDAYGPLMSSILLDAYKIPLPSVEISPDYNVLK